MLQHTYLYPVLCTPYTQDKCHSMFSYVWIVYHRLNMELNFTGILLIYLHFLYLHSWCTFHCFSVKLGTLSFVFLCMPEITIKLFLTLYSEGFYFFLPRSHYLEFKILRNRDQIKFLSLSHMGLQLLARMCILWLVAEWLLEVAGSHRGNGFQSISMVLHHKPLCDWFHQFTVNGSFKLVCKHLLKHAINAEYSSSK